MSFKKHKTIIFVGFILLALGYLIGRYLQPAKIEIKKEEVIKEVEVLKKDIKIVEREVVRPDGTKEKERIIEDRSQETVKKEKESKEKTSVSNKPDWKVSGIAGIDNFGQNVYGLQVERRVFGPVFVGVVGLTSKTAGLTISFEF